MTASRLSRLTFLFAIIALGLSFSPLAQADAVQSYQNQAGSVLKFSSNADTGAITGEYISALGCAAGQSYPLVGWRNNKAISFTVNFGNCGSITSWVGHVQDDMSIKTIWTLSRGENTGWDTLLTGSSLFLPLSPAVAP